MATHRWKHDVFISFRGEDTRHNFVCYLKDALRRTGHKTFVDDQLPRGEEINSELLQAIQDSKVALIIFSENYASSSWCLDELLKIIECHDTHNQIVIPVFYSVNPSDVRKQNGSFKKSFEEHSKNPRNNEKIQKWKDALTKAATISGRDSNAVREDNKLIDQIVKDVSEKLKHLYPCSLEGVVGLESKIREVKTLLATGTSDVRMVGIWGMGGIGKTTLAEAIFNEVSSQFEGSCFVRKVEESEEGSIKLLEKLISDLLDEGDLKIDTPNVGPRLYFLKRLKRKRVFVVFDDASNPLQLENLIGNQCWFGAGSNIIITSRDEKVLKGITDNIYEVEALSYTESHQLFLSNTFTEGQPSQDHKPLIDSFLNYAKGNPLAIKVLGSSVRGEGVKIWRDALKKLSNCPEKGIHDVLKVSYEGLNREEQAIFLHIACFFKGENKKVAKKVFKGCGLSANIGIRRLVGKSLVTISKDDDKLDMHDLLQDMGREIVRQELEDPRRRHHSRYWDAEEIRHVFRENEGTEAIEIESISLDTSQIRDDIVLDPNVFQRMPKLKFLKVYTSCCKGSKLHLTRGLHFLPSGLRYLYWDQYPPESLPTDFDAKELVVLHLHGSNIKQLLKGAGKLKVVAQSLIESPLISRVSDVFGKLPFGIGNKVLSSSCRFLSKITRMDMEGCRNLKRFPNNVDLQCLEILKLRGCSNLKIFPEISTNLRILDVGGTAIKEVHSSSIEGLSRLQEWDMCNCEKLESLPSNICKLQALQALNLGDCSRLKKFPEILEPMYNLRGVNLSCSGIEAISSSIDNMKGLESLSLGNCLNLACFPESFDNLVRRITNFNFSTTIKQRMSKNLDVEDLECSFFDIIFYFDIYGGRNCMQPGPFDILSIISRWQVGHIDAGYVTIGRGNCLKVTRVSLVSECEFYLIDLLSHIRFLAPYYNCLDLSHCSIRELPKDLGSLYYLRELDLRSNNFVEIPASIKQLFLLESLRLDYCPKLRSLPQLPMSLRLLYASCCGSLKTLLAFKQPIFNGCHFMDFTHCLKLEEKECEAMAYKLLRNGPKDVRLRYPESRITEWFRHQTTGDIITIKLPSNWFFNRRFFGFAFCVVLKYPHTDTPANELKFECYFENNCPRTILFPYQSHSWNLSCMSRPPKQQHVLVWSVDDFNVWISERRRLFRLHCINMASFKFFIKCGKIKKCGITPLYMQADEGYVQGDDDDQDDGDENAYWMLESLLLRKMSIKRKTIQKMTRMNTLKKKGKIEDTDDDMTPEDDEDELFETEDGLSEANDEYFETEDKLFEIEDGLSEANDEFFEITSSRTDVLSRGEKPYP